MALHTLSDIQASLLTFKPGAKALEVAAKDPLLAGVRRTVPRRQNDIVCKQRLQPQTSASDLGPDGKSKMIVDLKLSRPL